MSGSGAQDEFVGIARICSVVDAFQRSPRGLTIRGVEENTGLARSTAHRYLRALDGQGVVRHDRATETYGLGSRILPLPRQQLEVLTIRASRELWRVRDETGESVALAVLDGLEVRYPVVFESPEEYRVGPHEGTTAHLHASAAGKAIATKFDPPTIERMLAETGMQRLTDRTRVDVQAFLEDVAVTKARGYAIDEGERVEGANALAVPILGTWLRAAISLSAPKERLSLAAMRPLADRLRHSAEQIAGVPPPGFE